MLADLKHEIKCKKKCCMESKLRLIKILKHRYLVDIQHWVSLACFGILTHTKHRGGWHGHQSQTVSLSDIPEGCFQGEEFEM